jgi:hypothetical protein
MDVIWHEDESATKPSVSAWAVEKEFDQPLEGGLVVKDVRSSQYTECQEIGKVAFAVGPNAM